MLGVALLIVPILAKELPLMRDQVPVLFDGLNASLKPLLARFDVNLSLDVANIKAFVLKYLNANFEDAFGSMMTSLKLGGSVAFAIIGNAVLIPVALFYLLMDWDRFVSAVSNWCRRACAAPSTALPVRPTRCWASTCVASCWSC